MAIGAMTWLGSVIIKDTFFETFNQCAFATFTVFIEFSFTAGANDGDGCYWSFFIRFCHLGICYLQDTILIN